MVAPKLKRNILPRGRRTQVLGGHAKPVGAAIIKLEDKVVAAILVGNHRTGDVETAVLVRGRNQTAGRRHANPRQPLLAVILVSVQIAVVEYLADHVRAVEVRVGYDPHGRRRFSGDRLTIGGVNRLCPVGVFPFGDTRAHNQEKLKFPFIAVASVVGLQ
jgi:hypothetical protein